MTQAWEEQDPDESTSLQLPRQSSSSHTTPSKTQNPVERKRRHFEKCLNVSIWGSMLFCDQCALKCLRLCSAEERGSCMFGTRLGRIFTFVQTLPLKMPKLNTRNTNLCPRIGMKFNGLVIYIGSDCFCKPLFQANWQVRINRTWQTWLILASRISCYCEYCLI